MKKETPNADETKTDLKHDTMEFSAATDGDDKLDTDDARYEEEGISAEELDLLEDAPFDEEAAALNSAETDRLVDEDNLPEEDWVDDVDLDDEDEKAPDHHRTENED
jgi:hypothetical protein